MMQPGCATSSGKGLSRGLGLLLLPWQEKKQLFSPKKLLLMLTASSCTKLRAVAGLGEWCSELSEEGEISAVASTKSSMKGWEQGNLFSACTQQQAQAFPVAVTQQNLP